MFLAFYKHKREITSVKTFFYRMFDELTRFFTRGKYSHCEMAIKREGGLYDCYSASVRDGGVRMKTLSLNPEKWDLVAVSCDEQKIIDYYKKTKNAKYDFFGAIGLVLPFFQSNSRQFCSEWCFNALYESTHGWRFSPNQLFSVATITHRK